MTRGRFEARGSAECGRFASATTLILALRRGTFQIELLPRTPSLRLFLPRPPNAAGDRAMLFFDPIVTAQLDPSRGGR